jgi:integrase
MKNPIKFTDTKIKSLSTKKSRYDIRERDGFAIRVSPSGRKTWIFFYDYDGRRRRMSLGVYPYISLAKAKERHGDAIKLLRKGIDPGVVEQEKRLKRIAAPTIKELVVLYIDKYAKPKKRSWKEDERILFKDVVPAWGKRKAADIRRPDVIHLLESIADRGAGIQANRTLAVVRKMFNFAVNRGIFEYTPCANISPVAKERQKDRCLTEAEIKSFWSEVDNAAMADATSRILKLILVTAQRPGEIAGMDWSEIANNWWTIPADKAKNREIHRVFLTPLAMELIGSPRKGYVFPSRRGEAHIHINALAHAIRRNLKPDDHGHKAISIEHFTPHDLRRTAATQMTKMKTPRLVVAKILNHKERGVTAVYDRHGYDDEKRYALENWEKKLRQIVGIDKAETGKVIPMKQSRN